MVTINAYTLQNLVLSQYHTQLIILISSQQVFDLNSQCCTLRWEAKNANFGLVGWFMVFNATFNNLSVIPWRSVLLVEETGVPRENHWPVVIFLVWPEWRSNSQYYTVQYKDRVDTSSLCGSPKALLIKGILHK